MAHRNIPYVAMGTPEQGNSLWSAWGRATQQQMEYPHVLPHAEGCSEEQSKKRVESSITTGTASTRAAQQLPSDEILRF